MFQKNMSVAYLLDFYGDILDERTKSIMTSYYEDDLSLAEIANGENISRQGVRHVIKKGEDELFRFEEKFGLAKAQSELSVLTERLAEVKRLLIEEDSAKFSDSIKTIDEVIFKILNKGF